MEVELYVYDLSRGMARQMSGQLLGIHIDAVYHTSIVLKGVEYFFGAGVQQCYPGRSHHGAPIEIVRLGKTSLDMVVILEYLESLKRTYTAESYDLFLHNCNNFSNDFAMFLVGKKIPEHITSLPRTVLNTPFGQMLKNQMDSAMRPITQAPVPPQAGPRSSNGATAARTNGHKASSGRGQVQNVTNLRSVEQLLADAKDSCAVFFFTSSTCAPCKLAYPTFDELAEEVNGKATLIKVDINKAQEVAYRYSIRATPTFMTFLHGKKHEEWTGAGTVILKANVRMLIELATTSHPHTKLNLPTLKHHSLAPRIYGFVPPLDKLVAKMGDSGKEPSVKAARTFLEARKNGKPQDVSLPDLVAFGRFLRSATAKIQPESLFTAVDLLRLTLVDPRVSGCFAEEKDPKTILHLLRHVNSLKACPYNLRLVTLHMMCNTFASRLTMEILLPDARFNTALVALMTESLLDTEHKNVRVAAASLAFNTSAALYTARMEGKGEVLPESLQTELAAGVLEAIRAEVESKEALEGLVLALGLLLYFSPSAQAEGEIVNLCEALDATNVVRSKQAMVVDRNMKELVKEVTQMFSFR